MLQPSSHQLTAGLEAVLKIDKSGLMFWLRVKEKLNSAGNTATFSEIG
jgi:hypothetical protein